MRYLPKVPVPALVNSMKDVSARRLRSEFTGIVNRHITHGHLWSPSYPVASCGPAPLSIIRPFINEQGRPVNATSRLIPP